MVRQILIAAPARIARKLADAIGDHFEVTTCSAPEKAAALATAGTYLAIVKTAGFARVPGGVPIIRVTEAAEGSEILDELVAIRSRARTEQRARAADLAHLAALPYQEYVTLVRARTIRDYLLALLHRHNGVVAEAAREAGLLRETLHRLIRRHDIDPDWFRDE
jgi:hypothetical protein